MAEIDSLDIKISVEVDKANKSIDKLGKKLGAVSNSLNTGYKSSENFSNGIKKATQTTDSFLESIKGLGSNRQFFGGKRELEKEINSVKNQIEKAKYKIEEYENAGKGLGTKGWETQQRQLASLSNYFDNLIKKQNDYIKSSGNLKIERIIPKGSEPLAPGGADIAREAGSLGIDISDFDLKRALDVDILKELVEQTRSSMQQTKNIITHSDIAECVKNQGKKSVSVWERESQKLKERMENTLDFTPSKLGKGQSYTKEYVVLEKQILKAEEKLEKFLNTQERLEEIGVKKSSQRYKNTEKSIEDADKKLQLLYQDMKILQNEGKDINIPSGIEKFGNKAKETQNIMQSLSHTLRSMGFGNMATKFQQLSANAGSLEKGLRGATAAAGSSGTALLSIGKAVPVIGTVVTSVLIIGTAFKKVAQAVINFNAKMFKLVNGVVKKFLELGKTIVQVGTGTHQATTLVGKMWNKIVGIVKTRILRQAISQSLEYAKTGIEQLAKYSDKTGTSFNKNLSVLISDFKYLGRVIAAAFEPVLNAITPIIHKIIMSLVDVVNFVNQVFSAIGGSQTWSKAKYNIENYAQGLEDSTNNAKELNKQIREFDKLNVISSQNNTNNVSNSTNNNGTLLFETVPVTSNALDVSKMLKDAWANADFTSVGDLIAEKIGGVLDSIDWNKAKNYATNFGTSLATFILGLISWESKDKQNIAEKIGNFIAQGINTFVSGIDSFVSKLLEKDENGNSGFKRIGLWLASGIETAANNIDWDKIQSVSTNIGKGLAGLVNGIVEGNTLQNISKAVANVIKSAINACWGFVTNIDFSNLGTKIGDAINKFFTKMSEEDAKGLNGWQKLGQSVSKITSGIFSMFSKAIGEIDWDKVGDSIVDFMTSIDWGTVIGDYIQLKNKLSEAIKKAIVSGIEALKKIEASAFLNVAASMAEGLLDALQKAINLSPTLKAIADITGFNDKIDDAKKDIQKFKAGLGSYQDGITGSKDLSGFNANVGKYNDNIKDKNVSGFKALFSKKDTTNNFDKTIGGMKAGFDKNGGTSKSFNKTIGGMIAGFDKNAGTSSKFNKTITGMKSQFSSHTKSNKFKNSISNMCAVFSKRLFNNFNTFSVINNMVAKFTRRTFASSFSNVIDVIANITGTKNSSYRREKGGAYYGGQWHDIPQYANGGRPSSLHGSMFIAGERGPEIVGHVGGRTEVLNQSQLASAMYSSVANANHETNALLRQQNKLLMAILEKETNISYKDVFEANRKANNEFKAINGTSAFA